MEGLSTAKERERERDNLLPPLTGDNVRLQSLKVKVLFCLQCLELPPFHVRLYHLETVGHLVTAKSAHHLIHSNIALVSRGRDWLARLVKDE